MQAKFGIIEIPRSIETACENARLAEEHGFDMVGVADSQSLFRELFVTLSVIGGATERAGRTLEEIDIWALGRVNVGEDRAAPISEIRMELASTAHHAFRFTQEGKLVPPQFADAIREVQQGYKPSHHEDLGESPNAQLMQDPELLAYMVDRFAVLGTPEECVAQIQRIREAGIHQILFTGFVDDRPGLIENLGRHVFPRCRN